MAALLYVVTALLAIVAILYNPVKQRCITIGLFRPEIKNIHGHEMKKIPNTLHCEDLHHHLPSNLLFTACQTSAKKDRLKWFPPLTMFDPVGVAKGTIVVIDPTTFESKPLKLEGFTGPFITHGVDLYSSPADPMHVTIFAINHLPHPNAGDPDQPHQARSQIEVFRHTIGDDAAYHIRSVLDPLITTPNDIYATSASSFYVTNDHHYRDGSLRMVEEFLTRPLGGWTTTVHVSFADIPTRDSTAGVKAFVALTGLHNNNGLGHLDADNPDIVAIGDASGGELTLARRNLNPQPNNSEDLKLHVLEHIQLDSCIDNPSFYTDPYATPAHNASGFIIAGLAQGIHLMDHIKEGAPIPVMVWHLTPTQEGTWEKKLIFQDDGRQAGAAATAVLVGIDPADNQGKKQGWLFVTGFLSDSVTASLIDL